MAITDELVSKATEYLAESDFGGQVPSVMLVEFVIEKFKQHRNYPESFTENKIEKDMHMYLSTLAMAVVDIMAKVGAEGELSHSENGISRSYENAYISNSIFKDVLPFVKIL